jgi:hypothetical protein
MAEMKTKPTSLSVQAFLDSLEDTKKREDCLAILNLMQAVTGEEAVIWGTNIIGFGSYHYKYASGREGNAPLIGFSPRKQNLTLYINSGFERFPNLMEKLGKYKTGASCLYIKQLKDVDQDTLKTLIAESVAHMKATNPPKQEA